MSILNYSPPKNLIQHSQLPLTPAAERWSKRDGDAIGKETDDGQFDVDHGASAKENARTALIGLGLAGAAIFDGVRGKELNKEGSGYVRSPGGYLNNLLMGVGLGLGVTAMSLKDLLVDSTSHGTMAAAKGVSNLFD